ncbi:MAG: hypothetical protein Q9174_003381 [Haloplaca sp. 1 TL-2023]
MALLNTSSLVSSHKASDSGLQIHLHPLVLLTVSDLITRHILRRREGPIVGALLGQHNGRDIALEHAFECQVVNGEQGAVLLHQAWFEDRLQQYKDVHKAPLLELVGWFSAAPPSGPQDQHVPIHQQILHHYNETAVLLAFHPSDVLEGRGQGGGQGGKLPLTIYESVYEGTQPAAKPGATTTDGDMDVDGQEGPLDLKFRELPYSVDTGEAEMIGVDFVARGGGNATNIDTKQKDKAQASQTQVAESDPSETQILNDTSILSPEDEELLTSLTARANAVKMLHGRIKVLKEYLTTLPPSYLTSTSTADSDMTDGPSSTDTPQIDHTILRSVQALINRLPILIPADGLAFDQESIAEKKDVALVELLGDLTNGTKNIREMGKKFDIVNTTKQRKRRGNRYGQSQVFEDVEEPAVD